MAMVTVHGRTRCQFYQGRADWKAIRRVKQAVSIPVVANGDAQTLSDAATMLEHSGADAAMIGRGHYGAPWLAGMIAAEAAGETRTDVPSTPDEISSYVSEHYEDMLNFYGTLQGVRQARKHLGWYLDRHAAGGGALRKPIMTSTEPEIVLEALRTVFHDAPGAMRSAA